MKEFLFIIYDINSDDTKFNILVPSNVFDYKTEFIEFKELNDWYLIL